MEYTTFVGLDVHKAQITVAIAKSEDRSTVQSLGSIPNEPDAVAKLVRKLGRANELYFCYEAGPCGYGLYCQLKKLGAACDVVAPSLIPVKQGDRVKTDRKDAEKLARLHRSGELTPVWVPDESHEALRDLIRSRHDAKEDHLRHRQRLGKFLLRLGMEPPPGVKKWTVKFNHWLGTLKFEYPAHQIVLPRISSIYQRS